jgi:hypothetical protein
MERENEELRGAIEKMQEQLAQMAEARTAP